jgi:hypothetical protein
MLENIKGSKYLKLTFQVPVQVLAATAGQVAQMFREKGELSH